MQFNIAAITTGVLGFSAPLTGAFLTNASDIVNGMASKIGRIQNMEGQMALINATNVGYLWNIGCFPIPVIPDKLLT